MTKQAKQVKQEAGKKIDASHYAAILRGLKQGKMPKTSGEFIRARLVEGKLDAAEIAAETRKRFKGSTATTSDVSWNRGKLKREGVKLAAAKAAA